MNLKDQISRLSGRYGIPSQLVFAIAEIETGFEMVSWRFDPTWEWLWDVSRDTPFRRLNDSEILSCCAPEGFPTLAEFPDPDQETIGQKSLWGPFAQRGAFLRAAGCNTDFLTSTQDPLMAVHYALITLGKLRDRYYARHGWAGVAAAYRSGRPRTDETGQYRDQDYLLKLGSTSTALRKILWQAPA